jgi:hypothetical protein
MAMSKDPPEVPTENLQQYHRQWARLDPLGKGLLTLDQVGRGERAVQGAAGRWAPGGGAAALAPAVPLGGAREVRRLWPALGANPA